MITYPIEMYCTPVAPIEEIVFLEGCLSDVCIKITGRDKDGDAQSVYFVGDIKDNIDKIKEGTTKRTVIFDNRNPKKLLDKVKENEISFVEIEKEHDKYGFYEVKLIYKNGKEEQTKWFNLVGYTSWIKNLSPYTRFDDRRTLPAYKR